MPVRYVDLQIALEYVSSEPPMVNTALVDKETGRTYFSGMYDSEFADWPDDADDPDRYVAVPHKHELDLGRPLVSQFMVAHLPGAWGAVESIFSRGGAYRRFKAFLREHDLLEAWYGFEAQQTKAALLQWCAAESIQVIDDIPSKPA